MLALVLALGCFLANADSLSVKANENYLQQDQVMSEQNYDNAVTASDVYGGFGKLSNQMYPKKDGDNGYIYYTQSSKTIGILRLGHTYTNNSLTEYAQIPVLTENLENFKKSLEEEMLKEDEIRVQRRIAANQKELKPKKILDKKTIDDTAVLPILTDEAIEKVEAEEQKKIEEKKIVKEEIKEEEKPRKRDIIKELFKDRKEKNVEPPKVQIDERESKAILVDEKKEQSKTIPAKKENNSNQVTEVKKEEKKLEHKRIDYQPEILDETPLPKKEEKEKKESRYSDDDDF